MKRTNTVKLVAAMLAATTICGGVMGCRKRPAPSEGTGTNEPDLTAEGTTAETEVSSETSSETSPEISPELTLRDVYGATLESLDSYADYGFREVEVPPLLDISFDSDASLTALANLGSVNGDGAVSSPNSARLIEGRFGMRGALEFTAPTYITAPDLGEQEALTISLWVNLKDISTRASDADTRVTTLLDTQTGTGRVTLSFVHTGSTLNTDESGALVSNPKSTKLVFSVEGNKGGTFGENGLYANNEHYSNFEYTIPEQYNTWIAHPEGHCWFHIGVVYEPTTGEVTFYHNGKLDSTQRFTSAVKPVLNGIRFGAGYGENTSLDGKIDDICIFGQALTAEDMEILADFERDMWVYRTIQDWEESRITLYVDGAKGSDDNPGTKDAPFATVKKGVESIKEAGTRLVIAPGLYREAGINLGASGTEYEPIIIEAAVPGETIISGSTVISNWETTATQGVYSHDWPYHFPRQTGTPGNDFLARTDMLWVDGEPTEPVFSMTDLKQNTYYLDEDAGKVYFMTEKQPSEFVAEVPNLGIDPEKGTGACLLNGNSNHYFVLRGLTFTGAATRLWDNAMVSLGFPQHILVEDCQFNNTNTVGIGWENSWIGKTAEDILIRRCRFDNVGTSSIGVGFRTMNMVVEQSEFTDNGWKINWGKYDSPDPATVKMMVCKNIIYRGNLFEGNNDNDLWFDNFNWNVDVVGNTFLNNKSGTGVHVEIDTHGVRLRNNVIHGGVHFGNPEGAILENNILWGESEPLISHWDSGAEFRFGEIGPIYGWKDTVLMGNTFYYTGLRNLPYITFPKYACALELYAAGNRIYAAGMSDRNKGFSIGDEKINYSTLLEKLKVGKDAFAYLTEDPFADDGTVAVSFADIASTACGKGLGNEIPVLLTRPQTKECRVSYTVWDYDTNMKLRTGVLEFGQFENEKTIYVGEYDQNILIELSDAEGVSMGEITFHYQSMAKE